MTGEHLCSFWQGVEFFFYAFLNCLYGHTGFFWQAWKIFEESIAAEECVVLLAIEAYAARSVAGRVNGVERKKRNFVIQYRRGGQGQ